MAQYQLITMRPEPKSRATAVQVIKFYIKQWSRKTLWHESSRVNNFIDKHNLCVVEGRSVCKVLFLVHPSNLFQAFRSDAQWWKLCWSFWISSWVSTITSINIEILAQGRVWSSICCLILCLTSAFEKFNSYFLRLVERQSSIPAKRFRN